MRKSSPALSCQYTIEVILKTFTITLDHEARLDFCSRQTEPFRPLPQDNRASLVFPIVLQHREVRHRLSHGSDSLKKLMCKWLAKEPIDQEIERRHQLPLILASRLEMHFEDRGSGSSQLFLRFLGQRDEWKWSKTGNEAVNDSLPNPNHTVRKYDRLGLEEVRSSEPLIDRWTICFANKENRDREDRKIAANLQKPIIPKEPPRENAVVAYLCLDVDESRRFALDLQHIVGFGCDC